MFAAATPTEGLLHAVLIKAPTGRGEVLSVGATLARAMPSVFDIVSYTEAEALQASAVTALICNRTLHFSGRPIGLVAVHADMPEVDIAMVEEHDPHLPGGIKGVGMLGTAGIQAAIANAIHHAIGRRVRHLPIRIENLIAS